MIEALGVLAVVARAAVLASLGILAVVERAAAADCQRLALVRTATAARRPRSAVQSPSWVRCGLLLHGVTGGWQLLCWQHRWHGLRLPRANGWRTYNLPSCCCGAPPPGVVSANGSAGCGGAQASAANRHRPARLRIAAASRGKMWFVQKHSALNTARNEATDALEEHGYRCVFGSNRCSLVRTHPIHMGVAGLALERMYPINSAQPLKAGSGEHVVAVRVEIAFASVRVEQLALLRRRRHTVIPWLHNS